MATDNLTEQEIKDLIIKFNLDESINDLKRYYATPTTWEIINQSRKETRHTKQWSDGGDNPTFTKFREGVSNKYPNFQIDII